MLTIATCLWDANQKSYDWSRCYDETWVDKLYRGFARNLTVPFEFVVFTDRERQFSEPAIRQERLSAEFPDCGALVEPYRLDVPMILVGLDTIICKDCDPLAEYCLTADTIALPRDPYNPGQACTGVALVPAGKRFVWDGYDGNPDDMVHMRKQPHVYIDDVFPGEVRSFKAHVARLGWLQSRIVYFHGRPKPSDMGGDELIRQHWV